MTGSEQNDALKDIQRLGGAYAVAELSAAQLKGFLGVADLQKIILEQCVANAEDVPESGAVNKTIAPVHKRRQLWEKILSKQFPILGKVAVQYLSMHATSCDSKRNLSVFGALYDKSRNILKLEKAQKVVYLNVNERIKKKHKLVIDE
jgi:hypothetical protein